MVVEMEEEAGDNWRDTGGSLERDRSVGVAERVFHTARQTTADSGACSARVGRA